MDDTIAIGSLVVAVVTVLLTAWTAIVALRQNKQFSRANTIIHFTNAYLELIKQQGGLPDAVNYNDTQWENYWGLQSTEFYFFHRGVIPPFIYTLWMVDVADLYAKSEIALESHKNYVNSYKDTYPMMDKFFDGIADIAITKKESKARHSKIQEYVGNWIRKNKIND